MAEYYLYLLTQIAFVIWPLADLSLDQLLQTRDLKLMTACFIKFLIKLGQFVKQIQLFNI